MKYWLEIPVETEKEFIHRWGDRTFPKEFKRDLDIIKKKYFERRLVSYFKSKTRNEL